MFGDASPSGPLPETLPLNPDKLKPGAARPQANFGRNWAALGAGGAEPGEEIMELALAGARGVGHRSLPAALVLSIVWLGLAAIPGTAQQGGGPAAIKVPLTDLDAVPSTPIVGPSLESKGRAPTAPKPTPALPQDATSHHTLELPDR